MKIEIAASLAVVFGSLYTIFRKYQCVVDLDGTDQQFNQPMFQAFIIFAGMTTIHFFRPFMPKDTDHPTKQPESKYLYLLPSFLDVLGTILDTTGLFYVNTNNIQTSVSVSQMLKGSTLFFTYLITVGFGLKKLKHVQHFWMLAIVISLGMIGYSNISSSDQKYQSRPLLGNTLIILSQLIFALMFISEQKITKHYNIKVSNAVFWQGVWGVLICGIFLLTFSHYKSEIIQCDVYESCSLMFNNWKLLVSVAITAVCIAPFNYFGLMITKDTSALQRCLVCTSRMVVIWMLSLVFGWEGFSVLQFFGYVLLTFGIYKFNQVENSAQLTPKNEQAEPMNPQAMDQMSKEQQNQKKKPFDIEITSQSI